MIDPYRSNMKANADRVRERVEQDERRLAERESLRGAPTRPGLRSRIRRAWMALRRTR
jgi:hypothetical protein